MLSKLALLSRGLQRTTRTQVVYFSRDNKLGDEAAEMSEIASEIEAVTDIEGGVESAASEIEELDTAALEAEQAEEVVEQLSQDAKGGNKGSKQKDQARR
jgi:hypothetical protein